MKKVMPIIVFILEQGKAQCPKPVLWLNDGITSIRALSRPTLGLKYISPGVLKINWIKLMREAHKHTQFCIRQNQTQVLHINLSDNLTKTHNTFLGRKLPRNHGIFQTRL